MSKQARANEIYHGEAVNGTADRQYVIERIVGELEVSPAYASTLYNNARKAFSGDSSKTKSATSHAKPKTSGKISEITNRNIDPIMDDIRAALKSVETKYGITIGTGGCRYDSRHFTTKLDVQVGGAEEAGRAAFEANAWSVGLEASDYGRTFTSNGDTVKIVGIKPRSRKYPIIGEKSNGKRFKYTEDFVKRALKK